MTTSGFPFFPRCRSPTLRHCRCRHTFRRMDGFGRNEQDLAGLECDRRSSFDLILECALDDIDDLFARVPVPAERCARGEIDTHLDDFPTGRTQIVPLEIGSLDSRRLRLHHVQRNTTGHDSHTPAPTICIAFMNVLLGSMTTDP